MNHTTSRSYHKVLALLILALVLVMCRTDAFAAGQAQPQSEPRLAQLLAPIALYPDSLLTHILIASTYPLEVVEAQRWREQNKQLTDARLVERAEDKDWDPSIKALLPFPAVLDRMSRELSWTSALGDAFLADESQVLDMVQQLRLQADDAGNLQQMEQVTVTRVEKQIVIESVSPQIVYVPYYDPRLVFPYWRWPAYPPVWWARDPLWLGYYTPGALFSWRPGIQISFNFFFGGIHWGDRYLLIDRHGHHHYRPHYRQRIAFSQGAQRWHHDPHHRKGMRYASHSVHDRIYRDAPRAVSIPGKPRLEGRDRQNREFRAPHDKAWQHRTREQLTASDRSKPRPASDRGKPGYPPVKEDRRHRSQDPGRHLSPPPPNLKQPDRRQSANIQERTGRDDKPVIRRVATGSDRLAAKDRERWPGHNAAEVSQRERHSQPNEPRPQPQRQVTPPQRSGNQSSYTDQVRSEPRPKPQYQAPQRQSSHTGSRNQSHREHGGRERQH
ncbi:DUF3300 domain-containing protein [Shewanella sp. GXUN23E]|uniref:DUF3300 domain-containing protein n=1 Tax=Shewanella sp. GXUN23E TaxID=3422498 RepID=UPI003D7D50D6